MSSTTTPTPDRNQSAFVASHTDLVLALPEPGREWTHTELNEEPTVGEELIEGFPDVVQLLKNNDAIHNVGNGHDTNRHLIVWQTDRSAYAQAKRRRENEQTLPCNHRSGFETIVPGETYECGFVLCEDTYGPAAINEVFG